MIGMTKEEYLQKDLELKAAAEADDAALITVEEVEEEAEERGSNHPPQEAHTFGYFLSR